MRPETLKPGDVIGICSPSHIPNREIYDKAFSRIRAMGFEIKEAKNLYSSSLGYSASPRERADDFNSLARDPEVKMILFGGGEGSVDLIPLIDYEALKKDPKLVCSYSDGTTILDAIWSNTGLEVYYGQSVAHFSADDNPYHDSQFKAFFASGGVKAHVPASEWRTLSPGSCEGVLLGGYLLNFALLLGSRYFSYDESEDYVLFLEDHEKFYGIPYISSMLSYLDQTPFMDRVRGILFGHYSVEPNEYLFECLARLGKKRGFPVCYCDDFGHGANQAILPIGRKAVLDADALALTYASGQKSE